MLETCLGLILASVNVKDDSGTLTVEGLLTDTGSEQDTTDLLESES